MVIHIKTKKQRIRPCESLNKEADDQRVIEPAAIRFRTGAIDHPVHTQDLFRAGLPIPIPDIGTAIARDKSNQNSSVETNLAVRLHIGEKVRNLWGSAMAMYIPIRPKVTQKSSLFLDGKGLPNIVRHWTQAVDYRTPVDTFFLGSAYLAANEPQKAANRSGASLVPKHRPRLDWALLTAGARK